MLSSIEMALTLFAAHKKIRASEEKYRQLIENLNEGIWVIDKEAVTTFVNPKMAKILGYTVEEMIGKHLFAFMDEQGVQDATQKLGRRQQGIKEQHDFRFLQKDGTPIYASLETSAIYDPDGNYSGAIAGVSDITEQKRAKDEIKALLQEKELLLREVHHRIKNNMNTIVSLLKFQADSLKEPSAITALEDANNRILLMMGIYDKLYLSKDYRNINVKDYLLEMIRDIVLIFSFRKKVQIEKEIDNITLNTKIVFPLGIIINELITNAFKYAFPDDRAGTIQVSLLANEKKQLELIVRDNGIGMPEAIQINSCESIGLNLVKIFAQQIGARVYLLRENGTEFRISCPFENN